MTLIHHVALHVNDVSSAVAWYCGAFQCRVTYQDSTWAMLEFENVSLALVSQSEHPPHIAVTHARAERFGKLTTHRDGTRSVYVQDTSGNAVEILDANSV
jgi:catechol 2,3-dioxygenase-like lactoylglutathione lyase family enzyme